MPGYTPILSFLMVLIGLSNNALAQNNYLYPITQNSKVGYINSRGKVIITPQFNSAGRFSSGLAPSRLNGTYGFIDTSGSFVIPPQYDFALPFTNNVAQVFIDSEEARYINPKGQIIDYDSRYEIWSYRDLQLSTRGVIKSANGRYGYTDKAGNILLDTIYIFIDKFTNGYAVIRGPNHISSRTKDITEVGLIDTNGKFIIPFGICKEIHNVSEGYFWVIFAEDIDPTNNTETSGFIDTGGRIVLKKDYSKYKSIVGDINCGLAPISLYKYWYDEAYDYVYSRSLVYGGYINIQGDLLISDTNYVSVKPFYNNRAFVEINSYPDKYLIINTSGKIIVSDTFSQVLNDGFYNGLALVKNNKFWNLIDTNGNYVAKTEYRDILDIPESKYYYFMKYGSTHYGIAKKDGTEIYSNKLSHINRNGFENGLLNCVIDNKQTYIDTTGKIVWQQQKTKPIINQPLNIDFMYRGHFYAPVNWHKVDLNGFGGLDDSALAMPPQVQAPKDKLSIKVKTNKKLSINEYQGWEVWVINATSKEIAFKAQDNLLYMTTQALSPEGDWKDIEYIPWSGCGNSHHILTLSPQKYWRFTTPIYEGAIKTKLRIQLKYVEKKHGEEENITIYSNEYEGSINPGQLWRRAVHHPLGITYSYYE